MVKMIRDVMLLDAGRGRQESMSSKLLAKRTQKNLAGDCDEMMDKMLGVECHDQLVLGISPRR